MTFEAFVETYRLRAVHTGAEKVVQGKYGELADMSDREPLRFRLRLLAVPRGRQMNKALLGRRRSALAAGLEIKWKGESETILYFDPADSAQSKAAIKLVGAKVRRRGRTFTEAEKQAAAERLRLWREQKAA